MTEGINTYRFGFMPYFASFYTAGQVNKIPKTAVDKPDNSYDRNKFQHREPARRQKDEFIRSSDNSGNEIITDYTKFLFRGAPNQRNNERGNNTSENNSSKTGENEENRNKINELPTDKEPVGKKELSEAEKKEVEKLKKIDREVRAHEAAHKAAGGSLVTGGASYTYTTGPDGKRYVTGGEVNIDISYDLDDPQGTIDKMRQVRRAALAPSDPSAQDRAVAAKASQIEARARAELTKEQRADSYESVTGMMEKNKDSRIAAYQKAEETSKDYASSSFSRVNIISNQTLDKNNMNSIRI